MPVKVDGGPAFPRPASAVEVLPGTGGGNIDLGADGMTLRDWFAGQALTRVLIEWPLDGKNKTIVARQCYELADAMLAERSRDNG